MPDSVRALANVIEELQLLNHSLLPDERMVLLSPSISTEQWDSALEGVPESDSSDVADILRREKLLQLAFELVDRRGLWFEVSCRIADDNEDNATQLVDGDWFLEAPFPTRYTTLSTTVP